MIFSQIIIISTFSIVVFLILFDKVNRAMAALAGALVSFFTLSFMDGVNFYTFTGFLFGTTTDGFVNLHSLILILGMMFIVQVCNEAGVFQYYAFILVQKTKGKPKLLLLVTSSLSVLMSAILNNILTVIILIPLLITISRILSINPTPYIITSAILVNVGGMLFPISSIPNILITTSTGITYIEFFLNTGLISLLIFGITLIFFHLVYRNKLQVPKERLVKVLEDFNAKNFIQNNRLFSVSRITLFIVLICIFLFEPSIVALTGGVVLTIISKLEVNEIIEKIDFELLLYLLGIFVITGSLEYVGIIDHVGIALSYITGGDTFITLLLILWISAFLSSAIDNIPITKILIPIIGIMNSRMTSEHAKMAYYSLAFGANLGDNLTPMGDNILVMNIAEKNERPIKASTFFKLGFITTLIQLLAVSIYLALLTRLIIGLILILIVVTIIVMIITFNMLEKKYGKDDSTRYVKFKVKFLRKIRGLSDKVGFKKYKKD
ncbi:MAG: SLC13 family permease [Candidatus Helarchaeota archaeon]